MIDSDEMPSSTETSAPSPIALLQTSSSSSDLSTPSTSLTQPQTISSAAPNSSSLPLQALNNTRRSSPFHLPIDLDYTTTRFPSQEQNDDNVTVRAEDMVHFRYGRTERKWNRDGMDVDALFYKLAELNVTVSAFMSQSISFRNNISDQRYT